MPECPQCSLVNTPCAERCDCGYSFSGRRAASARTVAGARVEVKTYTYKKSFGRYMLGGAGGGTAKLMDDHIAELTRDGWEVLASGHDGGHINVGRTVMGAVLTGGQTVRYSTISACAGSLTALIMYEAVAQKDSI